jgi:hypothetical protein
MIQVCSLCYLHTLTPEAGVLVPPAATHRPWVCACLDRVRIVYTGCYHHSARVHRRALPRGDLIPVGTPMGVATGICTHKKPSMELQLLIA